MCTQTNHLVEHYIRQGKFDSALEKAEGNISHLVTMDLEDEDIKWCLFTARVLKVEILMSSDYPGNSKKEIEKAFKVIPDDIELWRLGVGVRRNFYERSIKLRTIKNPE